MNHECRASRAVVTVYTCTVVHIIVHAALYYTYDHVKHHVININMNLIFTISIALNHYIPVISTD